MPVNIAKTLSQLRSTRDLRAEMLGLAARLANNSLTASLIVVNPVISEATVREEWHRLLPAIDPSVQARLKLNIQHSDTRSRGPSYPIATGISPLDRPNYRYEVLRLLIGANLEDDGPQPVNGLIEKIGASQTPIRRALAELKQAGLCRAWSPGFEVVAEEVSMEMLARTRALPQTLRFRFERGTQIKPPATLLSRALSLLGPNAPRGWDQLSLSGTPVAMDDVPGLDLMGTPRLDLVAQIPRNAKSFSTELLRLLDDGLEVEPSVLAPAPVVLTLARADTHFVRRGIKDQTQCAMPMDVFLSLLDMGLREQALQYARAVRQKTGGP